MSMGGYFSAASWRREAPLPGTHGKILSVRTSLNHIYSLMAEY